MNLLKKKKSLHTSLMVLSDKTDGFLDKMGDTASLVSSTPKSERPFVCAMGK